MNFLSHIYLSGNFEKIMVGNFIGDFVKGNDTDHYEEEIRTGIMLHRSIDHFTDQHPIVGQSKDRLREKYRHYSSVIVDVFYDHFLAKNWHVYHHKALEKYTTTVYQTLDKYNSIFPYSAKRVFTYMRSGNWLLNYARIEGIDWALTGLSKRTTFKSGMENAHTDLTLFYEDFEKEFTSFFPVVCEFARDWIIENRL